MKNGTKTILLLLIAVCLAAGVEKPPVLEDASGEDIFLVDHSEYA